MPTANIKSMNGAEDSELQPHRYFIEIGGIESGPFDIYRLRQMWAAGEINETAKFKRTDWNYWADAEDLRMELEFVPPKDESTPPPIPPSLLTQSTDAANAPKQHSVKATSYKQRVIVKTYHGREQQATAQFRNDSVAMAAQGYYPTSQNFTQGSYSAASFVVAALLCFVCIGIIAFIYMLLVKPPGVLTVTYEYRQDEQQETTAQVALPATPPAEPRYFLLQDGAVNGPYNVSKLRAMRSAGQLSNDTPCCLEGSETWIALGRAIG